MTPGPPAVEASAAALAAAVLARPATLGRGRLVCIDGPAGSGKTTLAAALRRVLRDTQRAAPAGNPAAPSPTPTVRTVHMDDVYDGWDGLVAGMVTVAASVVGPLREGRTGGYRSHDWQHDRPGEERVVPLCDVLVVEGVGAGGPASGGYVAAVTLLVWVDTPSEVRLARGVRRDGEALRERLLAWRAQEDAMFARERIRDRADVLVDGLTGLVTSPPAV